MKKIKHFISQYKLDATKILLICFFTCLVILPLIRMLINISSESLNSVFSSENFGTLVENSLLATIISTLIVLVIAYLLAVCVERTTIRFKGLLNIILVFPMLIPSISHGMGLVVMFGNNGLLTRLLGLNGNIYGLQGIVVGSVMYAFPVAYLMIADVLKYQDCSPYQAAKVLGIPTWRQFTAITLPYLRKPLISVTLSVFTMIITDYGVPLMVGGKFKTLPVTLYQEVIGQLNFSKGSVYGLVLLIPAVIGFIFDVMNKDKGSNTYVIGEMMVKKNKLRDALAYIFCGAVCLFSVLPVIVFGILAFANKYPTDISLTLKNIEDALRLKAGTYLINSIEIAVFVAVIGVLVAFITAYLTARMKTKVSKFLHLFAITSAAIPGVVLGLSYILVFKDSFIYGTLAILIMVNIIHFISSPYLMMYNSLSKMNENLESVGHTLGASRFRIISDVIIPESKYTLMEMFSYFFVNSMMTISAVSFLSTTANKPVALMINQFEAQMQLEAAAVVSLAILFVNLIIKGTVYLIKRKISKRRSSSSEEMAA
ncbi:ABC transporter permease subunit [Holdemania massiliensis]|uniref:ABC transporter permease subunit n=1 Tax=Holdemania massiliensis TaxID=1468449 RepID=UPI0035208EA3